MKKLWEILVPTEMERDGKVKPIKTRYHRVWDDKVRAISGGLTIMTPVKGQWISHDTQLIAERMIPVRIVATEDEISKIAEMTTEYYNQAVVLVYEISNKVIFVNKPSSNRK